MAKQFLKCPKCGKKLFYLSTGYLAAHVLASTDSQGQVWVCRSCRHIQVKGRTG